MQIRKQIELHQIATSAGVGPAVIGLHRPVIYLPNTLVKDWTVPDLEPVLLHELAHVQRRDLLVNWLQILVQVVYCFHPAVWFVNWKIRRLREDVCDDIAVDSNGVGRTTYPASMLRVVQETGGVTMVQSWAMGFTETGKSLAGRITRICSAKYNGTTRLSIRAILGICVIALGSLVIAQCSTSEEIVSNVAHNAEVAEQRGIVPPPLSLENQPKLLGGSLAEQLKDLLVYPEEAREAGIMGQVIVKALIGTDGTVHDTETISAVAGHGFQKAAANAVKQLKFRPAQRPDGVPVKFWFTVPIRFSIASDNSQFPKVEPPMLLGEPLDYQLQNLLVYSATNQSENVNMKVMIKALIGTDGTVQKTEILRGSSDSGFDQAALTAVEQLQYEPAQMDGKPVEYSLSIPIRSATKSGYKFLPKH